MFNGLFIVLEGGDYAGKKIQSIHLAEHFLNLSEDNDILVTHEPTKRAKEIKRKLKEDESAYADAERMAELYVEDRVYHSINLIKPNLDKGAIVIGNRYFLSTLVYQSLQGVSLSKLVDMHLRPNILAPDLTILLDISPETGDQRSESRTEAPEKKFERKAFRDSVYQQYREVANSNLYRETFGWVEFVDGNKTQEEIFDQIRILTKPVYHSWVKHFS